ncbi:MAG: glycosyltransferase family 1 protein [Eubacterium sp.]|nr:glycosyltransferase family 1 protein [Eubacterium sp.]MBR0412844.1 glycosyltransferase family 1 protein [Eubacterium sp.]
MIRILHSVSNMDRAGIETMLMNFYRNVDREQVQFDFLCNKPNPGDYDEEIRALGGRIFVTPGFKSYRKYLKYMTKLFSEHPEYKIIHTHNGSLMLYALESAKMNKIPIRIAHAHATAIPVGLKNEVKKLIRPFIKYAATDYWGCSNAAGKFYFSEDRWNKANELIHNAINVDNFTFNEAVRKEIREQYGFGDKLVIGNVGRMMDQKNQKKLLDVFAEIHKINPETQLVIIGTGELEDKLRQQTRELGLEDAVTYTGVLSNVNEWYSVFDVFVMTSLYEGLPVVAVEAQAADLPCVLTDTITPEVKITDNVKFLGLYDESAEWAKAILEIEPAERVSRAAEFKQAGYNIRYEAKRMQELYLKLYSEITEKD